MINLHTHTLFSDGVLLPAEIVQYGKEKEYTYIGLTDHVDHSNINFVITQIVKVCEELNKKIEKLKLIPGIELTHIPPETIKEMTDYARARGAKIIIAHGETLVEPVPKGTNQKAIEAKVDILAHPGLITEKEVKMAKANDVYLEITSRKGHCLSNGHLVTLAKKIGANLLLNCDFHLPEDLLDKKFAEKVLEGAGLSKEETTKIFENSTKLVKRII